MSIYKENWDVKMNLNHLNISNRLKKCAEFISTESKIADIGTDHAYLPIYVALKNKVVKAIAADIHVGPLENAQCNIRDFNLENIIETRLSDGLRNINENEVDEVVIAGMGGNLIINILEGCDWKNKHTKTFILQPMKHEKNLRIYLSEKGYKVETEIALQCKNKLYTVMKVIFDNKPFTLSPLKQYIGCLNPAFPDTRLYVQKQIRDLENRKMGAIIRKNIGEAVYYYYLIEKLRDFIGLKEVI